jgi:hypothetical protein
LETLSSQVLEFEGKTRANPMEQRTLTNVNNYLNTNIYSYLKTSGGQSSNLYLNVVHFSTPELIRHLWKLKTIVFLHWCLICAVLLEGLSDASFLGKLQVLPANVRLDRKVIAKYKHSSLFNLVISNAGKKFK